jgi:hypothetical protein
MHAMECFIFGEICERINPAWTITALTLRFFGNGHIVLDQEGDNMRVDL